MNLPPTAALFVAITVWIVGASVYDGLFRPRPQTAEQQQLMTLACQRVDYDVHWWFKDGVPVRKDCLDRKTKEIVKIDFDLPCDRDGYEMITITSPERRFIETCEPSRLIKGDRYRRSDGYEVTRGPNRDPKAKPALPHHTWSEFQKGVSPFYHCPKDPKLACY